MRSKSNNKNKPKLTDKQRQDKINNTIIFKHHFKTETIYQKFFKAAYSKGYTNIDEFIKQEYFNTHKTQKEVAAMANCHYWDLFAALKKSGLAGLKKYKGEKRKYTKSKKNHIKRGKLEKRTPNTIKQTKKWYKCTNCGDKTRNRLLCDPCYTHADNEIEYDEHKVYD